ncbi:TPA: recombination protein RecR [Candidatus Kaiserbacteria bacterium]|nr:MAG: Recombination protein RecR [Parcubacteria group bacterium GW2011_GWA1_56_13]KKW46049.1 MAG: Recombination protein RecR [Parcubacteria group bacterium GW2011_GWB1_57_6]HCR52090.1 recombination protein RecR [Candidatus Kaiserbacteria bacterium]
MDHIEELARVLARFPGIGPRQGKRFVYYLLAAPASERTTLAELIASLGKDVRQCPECLRFFNGTNAAICNYCTDKARDDAQLMIVEKDQDLSAVERAGTYKGRYFVLGGVLTLSGKGAIREKELTKAIENHLKRGLKEVVLALSATSEGEHTTDRVRELLAPWRDHIKVSMLGRGLATGSELEYSDAETLRAALTNRKEA